MGSNGQGARRARRGFTAEFKAEPMRLLAERRAAGTTAIQVGRILDVRLDQLRAWARLQYEAAGAGGGRGGRNA